MVESQNSVLALLLVRALGILSRNPKCQWMILELPLWMNWAVNLTPSSVSEFQKFPSITISRGRNSGGKSSVPATLWELGESIYSSSENLVADQVEYDAPWSSGTYFGDVEVVMMPWYVLLGAVPKGCTFRKETCLDDGVSPFFVVTRDELEVASWNGSGVSLKTQVSSDDRRDFVLVFDLLELS